MHFNSPLASYDDVAPDTPAPIVARRGSDFLAEVQIIQDTADYLICQLGLQASLAAVALGMFYSLNFLPRQTSSSFKIFLFLKLTLLPLFQLIGIPGKAITCKEPASLSGSSKAIITPVAVVVSVPTAAAVVVAAALPSSFAITRIAPAAVPTPIITPVVVAPVVVVPAPVQTQIAAIAPVSAAPIKTTDKAVNACSSSDPEVCAQQALALTAHNSARALHHAPPLTWNDTLAVAALKWANNCQWMHSGSSLFPKDYVYGENLYAATIPTPPTTMIEVVAAYTDEEALYDYANPGYSDATGHFTQVVWKNTQQVGCAIITCDLPVFSQYTSTSVSFFPCFFLFFRFFFFEGKIF